MHWQAPLDKASVLYVSIKYHSDFGEALLKQCVVSKIYATVFKIIIPTLDFL